MAGEIQRRVRIVYEIDGVEGATEDQVSLEQALAQTGAALDEQSSKIDGVERSLGGLSDVATRSEQVQARLHQQVQALAGGLQGLSSILGTDTEAGALLGRMSQFASVGLQLGSVFGPGGAVVGGIVGGLLPALDPVLERLGLINETQGDVMRSAQSMSDEWERAAQTARRLASELGSLENAEAQLADRRSRDRARRLRAGDAQTGDEARLAATMRREDNLMLAGMGGLGGLAVQSTFRDEEADALEARAEELDRRRSRRGGGGGRRETAADRLGALMGRAVGGSDAIGFASGLGGDMFAPDESDVFAADAQRQSRNRRFGGQTNDEARAGQAQLATIRLVAEKQKQAHDEQMARIQQQVDAWTSAGERIGGVIAGAFKTAIQGQEDFGVAVIKGFKSIAIEFGGQMIAEGVGALFTAIGNTILNPPAAATKAAEGAGKIALGVGLGAAGAAIPVPSAGGGQAKPPRLGPASSGEGGGGSVTYNLNAPAVVTGTRAELGREMSRTIRQSSMRFGRAA